jgi:hypothetical protein
MFAIIWSKIFCLPVSYKKIQNCNFSSCDVWVVSHFEGGTQTDDFENRVLRRIFGPKREEFGSWRKLHNDELYSLYSSPNIVKVIKSGRMRWAGHVEGMREGRGVCRVLVERPERKRSLGRRRRRWEDNIKTGLREVGIDGANWIQLAQVRVK